MTPNLLKYLCEPLTKAPLSLVDAETDANGNIQSGDLVTPAGKHYSVVIGIPRFVDYVPATSVDFFNKRDHFSPIYEEK